MVRQAQRDLKVQLARQVQLEQQARLVP